jgi:Mrp family chromosome partitioning ATPase
MDSAAVRSRASELLGGTVSAGEIGARTDVQSSTTIDLLLVRANGSTPEDAAALANAVTEAYRLVATEGQQARAQAVSEQLATYRTELQQRVDDLDAALAAIRQQTEAAVAAELAGESVETRVETTQRRISGNREHADLSAERNAVFSQLLSISTRADQAVVEARLSDAGIASVEPASPPARPSSPQTRRDAALAGGFGLLAGSVLAWWCADRRTAGGEDLAAVIGAPRLGEIPYAPAAADRLPRRAARGTPVADAYQLAAAALTLTLADRRIRSVLVTGARQGCGTTSAVLNLGAAAARGGRRVAVVDADLVRRTLSRVTGRDGAPGLPELAGSGPRSTLSLGIVSGDGGGLRAVGAGVQVPDPAAFFSSTAFAAALEHLRPEADLVLVDSPPLPSSADTLEMAAQVEGIVLVVSGDTGAAELAEARDRLALAGAPLLGFVATDVRRSRLRGILRLLGRRDPAEAEQSQDLRETTPLPERRPGRGPLPTGAREPR